MAPCEVDLVPAFGTLPHGVFNTVLAIALASGEERDGFSVPKVA